MIVDRRLLAVLAAIATIILGIFAIAGFGDVTDELAGGVIAAGAGILAAHL